MTVETSLDNRLDVFGAGVGHHRAKFSLLKGAFNLIEWQERTAVVRPSLPEREPVPAYFISMLVRKLL